MAGFSPSGGSSRERSGEHGTIAGLALCSRLSPFNQESDRARAADGALNMVWIERQFASYLLKLKIRSYFFVHPVVGILTYMKDLLLGLGSCPAGARSNGGTSVPRKRQEAGQRRSGSILSFP
jgi:hypothetical protein